MRHEAQTKQLAKAMASGFAPAMLMIRRRSAQAGLDAPPGNVLGGLLVAAFGWRSTYFMNVPFALVTMAMAVFWIPRDAPAGAARHAREVAARIDVIGMVGFAVAMTGLLVFLLSLPYPDWIALAVAIMVAVALVFWELRGHPLLRRAPARREWRPNPYLYSDWIDVHRYLHRPVRHHPVG